MSTRNEFGGRILISRDAIRSLLGLPEDVRIDLYFDYEKDIYQVLMESKDAAVVNGQQITFPVEEGCMLPVVNYYLTERPKTTIVYCDEFLESDPEPEPQPKDIIDDFNDLLNE